MHHLCGDIYEIYLCSNINREEDTLIIKARIVEDSMMKLMKNLSKASKPVR
jgi:hypothetical protein